MKKRNAFICHFPISKTLAVNKKGNTSYLTKKPHQFRKGIGQAQFLGKRTFGRKAETSCATNRGNAWSRNCIFRAPQIWQFLSACEFKPPTVVLQKLRQLPSKFLFVYHFNQHSVFCPFLWRLYR